MQTNSSRVDPPEDLSVTLRAAAGSAWRPLAGAMAVGLLVSGCSMMNRSATNSASAAEPAARVQLMTAAGAPAGEATLYSVKGATEIVINATGLKPGVHGFHIHTNGVCAPAPDAATGQTVAFGAAGGHFDPGASGKHGQPGEAPSHNHAGDLPNLVVEADGRGAVRYVNSYVTIAAGPQSVMGRALVVHADPDDYMTNPAGMSGARVLCGVIKPA
jgi:Cu-Zn family superoxide dismutase